MTLSFILLGSSSAATVPEGAVLAAKQSLVINNGTEVASLDPHKTEGVPESNIILNLLEGLVSNDNYGHLVPGVAERWENREGKIWTFIYVPMQNGAMAMPSPRRISFIAGSDLSILKRLHPMPATFSMHILKTLIRSLTVQQRPARWV